MMDWILERARERSTWLGLVSLLTAIGITLSPDQVAAIIAAGVAIGSLVAVFTRDK